MVPVETVKSKNGDPCHVELLAYTECVKGHPNGLKESDCNEIKSEFKHCMKTVKISKVSDRD
jgi:hypothetical protein